MTLYTKAEEETHAKTFQWYMEGVESRKNWYKSYDCTHAHCPEGCEHPQPYNTEDGRLMCGECWFRDGIKTEMIPCNPVICQE